MTTSYKAAGIGILYALIIVGLIATKLAGHLAWAWWVVLIPIWVPIALFVVGTLLAIVGLLDAEKSGRNPFQ